MVGHKRVGHKRAHKITLGFGYTPRAAYACHPQRSRGRLIFEPESPTRSAFQRDRDRLIHSNAFRRLKHKTQVFIFHEDDHYRTRLTHTIEVSQIARALARALHLDEELAEAIALAHDFGHTPFGHAGEAVLNRIMEPFGGFDHNAHSLRIVTKLEHRYAAFDGLNLCWETLEGLVKHNGPLLERFPKIKTQLLDKKSSSNNDVESLAHAHDSSHCLPHSIIEFNAKFDLALDKFASAEAQCAAIADDIAYNAHDIDDGLRGGLLNIASLRTVPLLRPLIDTLAGQYINLDLKHFSYELVRRQITLMVEDVIEESLCRLETLAPKQVEDVYNANAPVVAFSPYMTRQEKELKKFLFDNLYFHDEIMTRRQEAEHIVEKLFTAYMNDITLLPPDWLKMRQKTKQEDDIRLVGDFLAGMTDTYALRIYQKLFGGEST